jgi:uncharacterized protein
MCYARFSRARFWGLAVQWVWWCSLTGLLVGCHSAFSNPPVSPSPSVSPAITNPTTPAAVPSDFAAIDSAEVAASGDPRGQILPITARAELKGKTFQLEVAATPDQQALGLMYRPALPSDRGMLFPFHPARPVSFWMMNVPVALDMVFIYQGRVVAIAAQAPPCTKQPCPYYGPNRAVDQVLELRSGRAEEIGLSVGDPVKIQHDRL